MSYYRPGQYYVSTGGTTLEVWENARTYAKSLPMPRTFTQKGASSNALYGFNFSGINLISLVLCDPEYFQQDLGDLPYNEHIVQQSLIPDGKGQVFNLLPDDFILSISGYSVNSEGTDNANTFLGRQLSEIEGQHLQVQQGSARGEYRVVSSNVSKTDSYAEVSNKTNDTVTCKISRIDQRIESPQQIAREKKSRTPDQGPAVTECKVLAPKEVWYYKRPSFHFNVFALCPQVQGRHGNTTLTNPPLDDYVNICPPIEANIGDTVILFKRAGNAGYRLYACPTDTIKPVATCIVTEIPR